jgi:hypothetical protein
MGECMEIRVDKISEISSVTKTDEGYLRIKAPVARTGVYKYRLPDGSIQREYIPPDTLFSEDSIDSLKLKPVTKSHPSKFVDSKSFNQEAVGFTSEKIDAEHESKLLMVDFLVTSEDGISYINSGVNQLSPAYTCEVEMVSGLSPDGERYDAVQRNRKYNHLALVDKARGGDLLSFKMDSEDDTEIGIQTDVIITEGDGKMAKSIKIDGVDHAIEDSVATHIAELNKEIEKIDSLENEKVSLQAKIDAKDAEIETLKQSQISEEEINKRVDSKVSVIEAAKKVLGDCVKTDSSEDEIMTEVVLNKFPQYKEKIDSYEGESKSVYLKALFDASMDFEAKSVSAENRKSMKSDSKEPKVDSREKFIEMIENKYKEA